MSQIHKDAIIIDGLVVADFNRSIFEQMQRGGITAANCTCSIWEDFEQTVLNISKWKKSLRNNQDIITQIYQVEDIYKAKREGKVGIILGWQNSSGYGDNLDNVALFAELGVRIVQLTYNTANSVGSGCYESRDGGLTDFGHDLVTMMNASGVMIDLSHVGPNTAADVIAYSKKPVAYTHCAPAGLKSHPRNKTDEQLRAIANAGGFIGVVAFPSYLANGNASTIEDYLDAIEYVINLAGEEQVGIGSDFTQGHGRGFFDFITHDKGNGRKLVEFDEVLVLEGLEELEKFPNITIAMERRGWKEDRIEYLLGGNWIKMLTSTWNV